MISFLQALLAVVETHTAMEKTVTASRPSTPKKQKPDIVDIVLNSRNVKVVAGKTP